MALALLLGTALGLQRGPETEQLARLFRDECGDAGNHHPHFRHRADLTCYSESTAFRLSVTTVAAGGRLEWRRLRNMILPVTVLACPRSPSWRG
jgi:hypothetical protein